MGLLNSLVNSLTALKIYVLFIVFIISSCFLCHSIFQDLLIVGWEEGKGSNFIFLILCLSAEVTHGSNCMLGNNRIAGLFTVLFMSNACHNLLQQPKRSILSFITTFVQAENCSEYCAVLFIFFPKVISCNNRFNYQQNNAFMLLAVDK